MNITLSAFKWAHGWGKMLSFFCSRKNFTKLHIIIYDFLL